ncbi:MAG: malonyl-CoA decarboxylase [Gammaproteobacteria bacterium]|nr:malonyl-CoA decarboxylase [Gammaproteobacteria bacterium]
MPMRITGLKDIIAGLTSAGRGVFEVASTRRQAQLGEMCEKLLDLKGEASVIVLAHRILELYATLEEAERIEFFEMLRDRFGADEQRLGAAISDYQSSPGPDTAAALADAAEAPRQELFRLLNTAPNGTAALIEMREHLLRVLRKHPQLAPVDRDIEHLLLSWFNRGFLTLRRIDWQTPAFILEKLIAYEAVHEIRGWPDLQRRLANDRRCYGFFHPALPDDPLIFVQVALVKGLADSIQTVLDSAPPAADEEVEADTAIFYSISNCQRGLSGITFGNFLIKQVTDSLARDVPGITRFSTLSPIPGFRRHLETWLATAEGAAALSDAERELLADGPAHWLDDEGKANAIKPLMMHLCADYLLNVKRGEEPGDPVARFHLRNGARLERLNWLGDRSEKGLRESYGLLVNYVYDRKTVAQNHEAYVNDFEVVCSSALRSLAAKRPKRL